MTDQERFAYCDLNDVLIEFAQGPNRVVVTRRALPNYCAIHYDIKSSKHALKMWRKCVDKLMVEELIREESSK